MSNEFMPCRTASTVGQPMWVAPLFMEGKMRILMLLLVIAAFLTCIIFVSDFTFSHSGRTDRDGGHLESASGKFHYHDKLQPSIQKTDRRYLLLVETIALRLKMRSIYQYTKIMTLLIFLQPWLERR